MPMQLSSILLMMRLITGIPDQPADGITITRAASDKQIEAAEGQSLKQFGFRADIQVLGRNSEGEITSLTCICYEKSGKKHGSCSSDNFGALVIKKDGGCQIADKGHENKIL